MHTAGIIYCLLSLVIIGCIVAVTVVYVSNPCCDQEPSESFKVPVSHDHPVSEHTPVRQHRQIYHAGVKPKYGGHDHRLMSVAEQNSSMWARHGYVHNM